MAYVGLMHEVQNYAIYDEDFLKVLKVQPENLVSIQNPVAEHLKYLVSSLMPHLLKNIVVNVEEHEKIRFFEWGRTWHLEGQKVHEARVLAGILYDKKSPVDFYESKNFLLNIFSFFGLEVTWQRNDAPTEPWFAPHQTADLMVGAKRVGRAGKINQFILQRVAPGDAFIFELDGDFFLSHTPTTKKFVPSSKYPVVERDISMHIPVTLTAQHIAQRIKGVDPKIVHVILIDFFEKKELLDQRSVTFRFVIEDHEKTLTKEEADAIWDLVSAELKNEGAIIR
jgi:phenylalanyl-tRNA synthetase beta chain